MHNMFIFGLRKDKEWDELLKWEGSIMWGPKYSHMKSQRISTNREEQGIRE